MMDSIGREARDGVSVAAAVGASGAATRHAVCRIGCPWRERLLAAAYGLLLGLGPEHEATAGHRTAGARIAGLGTALPLASLRGGAAGPTKTTEGGRRLFFLGGGGGQAAHAKDPAATALLLVTAFNNSASPARLRLPPCCPLHRVHRRHLLPF